LKEVLSRLKKMAEPARHRFQQAGEEGIPLRLRFFLFLAVLVLTIFLGFIAILLLAGTFTAGLSETERFFENELARISDEISEQYGQLSLQTVELAEKLSRDIEQQSSSMGIFPSQLGEHPYMLEEIIAAECDELLLALQLAKSSGVFFILDATINPALVNAANSKAGLYIKNMEPNVISATSPNIIMLRGFPAISRKKSLPLHAQWQLEFDVSDAPYYHRPMEAARANPGLPLSRLYFWSAALRLPDTSEEIMLCSAPLIDSKGHIFGVCGFEISAMLFKLSHSMDSGSYKHLFCLLSPLAGDTIELEHSFIAGGYAARIASAEVNRLQVSKQRRHLYSYRQDKDHKFLGLHTDIQLYPRDSVFADQRWIVTAMVPEADILVSVTWLNIILFSSLTLLVIIGVIVSFNLGNRLFIKPISQGFNIIKSSDLDAAPKVKVPEIDALIDHLALRNRELAERARQENLSLDTLNRFLEKTRELTPAEREVFKLYGEGLTAKEIAARLYLSINTIKTHSKRIYSKLEVSSREEIILYTTLLREMGKEIN
jgi:RNA polymerase sigma factor (sigma-70 family)